MKKRIALRAAAAALAISTVWGPVATQADGFAGAYLAGSHADVRNDYDAAATFYQRALAESPDNPIILQNALVTNVGAGQIETAVGYADRLVEIGARNQFVNLTHLSDAFAKGDFSAAEAITSAPENGFNPLFAGLIDGWVEVGKGNNQAAYDAFDSMNSSEALRVYGQYHKALAMALAGDYQAADEVLQGGDTGPLHLNRTSILAHAAVLGQLDRADEAIAIIDSSLADGASDPGLRVMRAALELGEKPEFTAIPDAAAGAADAMLIIAAALSQESADRIALFYARLATHMRPDLDEAKLLTADVLAMQAQHGLAIETYSEIQPGSAWYISAEIGRSDALAAADRDDEAIEVLSNLSREQTENLPILNALGDLLRRNERYDEAADAYSRAVSLISEDRTNHWVLYYSRGIAFERTDRWDQAEADFRKALELRPEQPLVLNYLGYSLVELRRNLEEAQAMIEKAVEQRPNDGYITDSLGWVLYRLGKYEEAVPLMERAVELMPVDPIINDHLGDVLWKVGRTLEAEFQWRRALSFEPEDMDAERIRRKLEIGLDAVLAEESIEGKVETIAQDDG